MILKCRRYVSTLANHAELTHTISFRIQLAFCSKSLQNTPFSDIRPMDSKYLS